MLLAVSAYLGANLAPNRAKTLVRLQDGKAVNRQRKIVTARVLTHRIDYSVCYNAVVVLLQQ